MTSVCGEVEGCGATLPDALQNGKLRWRDDAPLV
jgi:hypothetical protein